VENFRSRLSFAGSRKQEAEGSLTASHSFVIRSFRAAISYADGYSYGNHHTTSNSYTNGNGDEYAKANAKAAADTASSAVRIG
jgi:hypothetical protein